MKRALLLVATLGIGASCAFLDRWHTTLGYLPERDGSLRSDPNWSTSLDSSWYAEVGVSGDLPWLSPRPAGDDRVSAGDARPALLDQQRKIEDLEEQVVGLQEQLEEQEAPPESSVDEIDQAWELLKGEDFREWVENLLIIIIALLTGKYGGRAVQAAKDQVHKMRGRGEGEEGEE